MKKKEKKSNQRMDINLVTCPEINTLKNVSAPEHLVMSVALKVLKKIEKYPIAWIISYS